MRSDAPALQARAPLAPALLAIALCSGLPAVSAAQPLSAIDWLTDSVKAPPKEPPGTSVAAVPPAEAQAKGAISVRPLGAPSLDGLGTLKPATIGLGPGLWQRSDLPTLTRLIAKVHVDRLPALRGYLIRLLQVAAAPPDTARQDGELLLARIDRLLDLGALTEAQTMLELTDLDKPRFFRRWFDVSLLLGASDKACEKLAAAPDLDPTVPTRVFCLARRGDWDAAALNLETGKSLGLVPPAEDALLRRFLDQTNAAENGALTQPTRITPLTYRLYEAIGEPISSELLPRAFAFADLEETNGWKTRLRAAERLAAAGVLPGPELFALYQAHKPSASGGVFDRAALLQAFVAALDARDGAKVAEVLPRVWSQMVDADLGTDFAAVYAGRLTQLALPDKAAALAHRIALLAGTGPGTAAGGGGDFLDALARGAPTTAAASGTRAGQIQQGYASQGLPQSLQVLLDEKRQGEAVLRALDLFATGADGDGEDLINAIRLMRALGLESLARRASLQLMILDPRG